MRALSRSVLAIAYGITFVALAGAANEGCTPSPATSSPPLTAAAAPAPPRDPLPSWSDGSVKRAIVDYVNRTTTPNGADLVPLAERVAVFDNDGTLWQEKPVVEGVFAAAELEKMATSDPSLRTKEPYAALLDHDLEALKSQGEDAILKLFTVTQTGMTDDVYAADVNRFLASAKHPRFHVAYTELTYAPMIELLGFLKTRGFTNYICSGGDVDFMRVFAWSVYGIPPERVMGSRFVKERVMVEGESTFLRKPQLETINDKEAKPIDIDRVIGRRPIFAAGNVGGAGDIAMLSHTKHGRRLAFALVIDHDDAERESAYTEKDDATLSAARENGFAVVSMKHDWKKVFRPAVTEAPGNGAGPATR